MWIYTLLVSCGLVLGINGQVQMEVTTEGRLVTGETVNIKFGAEVVVKCLYDNLPPLPKPGVYYKDDSSSSLNQIFVYGSDFQQPWADHPDNYEKETGTPDSFYLSFKIKAATMEDAGIYVCILKDSSDSTVGEAEVQISVAANVQQVTLQGVEDGRYKVSLTEFKQKVTCLATNGSLPTMNLRIAGLEDVIPLEVTEDASKYEGTTLYGFTADQNGQLMTCEAVVPGYESDKVSDSATLLIVATPKVTCPASVEGKMKQSATITCTVEGDPMPKREDIQWVALSTGYSFKADEKLGDLGLESTIEESGGKYYVTLTVTLELEQSFGTYTLEATNEGGYSKASVELEKEKPKPGPAADANCLSKSSLLLFSVLITSILFYH